MINIKYPATAIRLISFIIVLLLIKHLRFYLVCYTAILYGHYVISTAGFKNRAKQVFKNKISIIKVVLTVFIGCILTFKGYVDVVILFSLHHAFGETYIFKSSNLDRNGVFNFSRISFNLLSYFCLILKSRFYSPVNLNKNIQLIQHIDIDVLYSAWAVAAVLFIIQLVKRYRVMSNKDGLFDEIMFELVGIAFVISAYFTSFDFTQLVFYHILVWFFLPLHDKKWFENANILQTNSRFKLIHFFLPIPFFAIASLLKNETLASFIYYGGQYHIFTTIIFSKYNPKTIIDFFEKV